MGWIVVLGMAAAWGCSSSRSHESGMMAMHCSQCNTDMMSDTTIKCKCDNDVKLGDLKVKCPQCNAEARLADCTGTCSKCGSSISQSSCKVKCPKCGGEADAKNMGCYRCMGGTKK